MRASTDPKPQLYCAICEQQFHSGEMCPTDGTRLVRLAVAADPLIGRDLDGRYTIIEKLGQGGMGSVYRAKQHSMGREVAIKLVNPALTADPPTIKRFLREAKLASRLAHPNIVSVFEFGQTGDGLFYLVMELVAGRTLHHVIHEEGRVDVPRLVRIASQICDALEGAHALPIIHRDLKPANVMLLAHGRDLVKVLDFGLAKSLSPDTSAASTMTSAGALMGTPTFMPPEVANGAEVDARADLYSLGCILFLIGSGRAPFVTDSIPEMIAMHGTQPAPPMTGVPAPIAAVIDRLLRKSPDERYPSAAAVRTALEHAYDAARTAPVEPIDVDRRGVSALDETATSLVIDRASRDSRDGVTTPYQVPEVSLAPDASIAVPPSEPAMRPSLPATMPPRVPDRSWRWIALAAVAAIGIAVAIVVARREMASPPPSPETTSRPPSPETASPPPSLAPVATPQVVPPVDAEPAPVALPVDVADAVEAIDAGVQPAKKERVPKKPHRKPAPGVGSESPF